LPKTVSETPGCENCPVRNLFPNTVFVPPLLIEGSTRLACAECPGSTEVEQGTPLVGASGSWLRGKVDEHGRRSGGLYKAAGVDQSTVSLCNVINCGIAADHHNIYPTDTEARSYIAKEDAEKAQEHCLNAHVLPTLRSRTWSRIDILGSKALHALCKVEGGIERWRGSPLPVPALGDTALAVPTYHPSYIARDQSVLPAVISDLAKTTDLAPEYYNIQPTIEDVRAFTATTFSFDIECVRETGKITMVGLSDRPFYAMCVPFAGAYKAELKRIFENAEVLYTQNGIQFDIPRLFPELGLEWRPE
jgi:uracil-DNA glycosylase